jgi:choline dehydrogenase-like flavoprotein
MPARATTHFRGREGPPCVTNPEPRDRLFATIIKAAGQIGIRHNPDYNGASQEGIAMSQATIAGGRRMSTARCYLDPARNRGNLHIETEALTERLLLDGKHCTDVRYSVAGKVREARGGRTVVVTAGAFNSPQLLELSGIGQPERLCNLGIEVRHELPGVGENLRDRSLCKGWCCRNGDDNGFLDELTLTRLRVATPDMTEGAILWLYLARVPAAAYRDSCIFHGKQGCTLDRSLRADICNSYFCGSLGAYMKTGAIGPIRVIAGEGDKMRTSPVLTP